jgi:hypothetical protein
MVKAGAKQFVRDGRTFHGIGFMVSIRPGDNVETEFGTMVDTIYKWYEQNGEACGELTIGFVADPADQESLMAYLMSLIQQEVQLRPLFVQLGQIEASFISRDGKEKKDYKFKMDS